MDKNEKHSKKILVVAIIINLLLIIVFKYTDFLINNINSIFKIDIPFANIALPIGISFYTFQIISYIIEVYRKKVKVQKNIIKLGTYIALFPQLMAGPIVRYQTIEKELSNRKETFEDFVLGLRRFIFGLGKKVIIANNMALIADTIYNNSLANTGTALLWIAALAYTFQIYFDFSGYSDMAIGLGRMFGFKFLENFNYPYIAKSITDFWRRWHISLSSWFKDYLYIPLGGNRCSKKKWIRNVFIVWFLTGLWHGASWNFVLWGLYFSIFLILEKTLLTKIIEKTPKIIRWTGTFLIVIISWVIFRLENFNDMFIVLKNMFIFVPTDFKKTFLDNYDLVVSSIYFIPAILGMFPYTKKLALKYSEKNIVFVGMGYIITLVILIISIALLLSNTYNPFIYFRF